MRAAGRIPCASSRSSRCPAPPARAPPDERLRLLRLLLAALAARVQGETCDQPLLRTVVQVAHDAAAGIVCLGEQTRPRSRELVTAVGVGDRGVEQLGELGHPLLGVGRRRLLAGPARRDRSPRAGRRRRSARRPPSGARWRWPARSGAGAPSECSIRAGRSVRRTIAVTLCAVEADPRADGSVRAASARVRDDGDLGAGLVAVQRNVSASSSALHLPGHRVEDRGGRAPCATSVATRRSAACSSASRVTSARDSALAIAVATAR